MVAEGFLVVPVSGRSALEGRALRLAGTRESSKMEEARPQMAILQSVKMPGIVAMERSD